MHDGFTIESSKLNCDELVIMVYVFSVNFIFERLTYE